MTVDLLTQATWLAVALLVLALVVSLVGVLLALWKAGNHLARVQSLLRSVQDHTEPLDSRVQTINGALLQLRQGLGAADQELAAAQKLFES